MKSNENTFSHYFHPSPANASKPMKSKTPEESFKDWPKYHPHHIYPTLKFVERLLISAVYRKIWKHSVSTAKLKRNETAYCEFYFKEIHARYYQRVVQGPQYVTTSRLIRNFLISKANENLRAVISALNPYNLTAFTNGIRSQIELNALRKVCTTPAAA